MPADLTTGVTQICYSEKYFDEYFEYRVIFGHLGPVLELACGSLHNDSWSIMHSDIQDVQRPYAIWNPDFRHTRVRFPELIQHLDLTNFSCGTPFKESPWDAQREAGPPKISYSLQSTSRFSYQDPTGNPLLEKTGRRKRPTRYDFRPSDGPAIGIVPNGLPRLSEDKNIVNTKQGREGKHKKKNPVWTNSALREIWRSSGRRPLSGLLDN